MCVCVCVCVCLCLSVSVSVSVFVSVSVCGWLVPNHKNTQTVCTTCGMYCTSTCGMYCTAKQSLESSLSSVDCAAIVYVIAPSPYISELQRMVMVLVLCQVMRLDVAQLISWDNPMKVLPIALIWCWRTSCKMIFKGTIKGRHDERDGVSNHQSHDLLLNRLFRRRSKKISKLRVTGLCAGNSLVTGDFPAQRASNAENVSIWWRHHVLCSYWLEG